MWKEEEHGNTSVNTTRFAESLATGAEKLAVGCPFCMVMLSDAAKEATSNNAVTKDASNQRKENQIEVLDIAEIVAAQLEDS